MRYLVLLGVVLLPLLSTAAPRDQHWQAVRDAMNQGLPKTAIEKLQPILTETRQEGAHAEYARAAALQVVLETRIEGRLAEEAIRRLQGIIPEAPAPAVPVLETLLAHAYWSYFQGHRWQFLNRTATTETPGEDFTTWDLPRILREIDAHFQKALSDPDILKQTAVAEFDALLDKGTLPDSYRPTLYDFLAHEALQFYSAGEQAATSPEDRFELKASTPIFDPLPQFLAWQFREATTDTNSPVLRALAIFQDLLRFHENDADRSALLDADLARILYGAGVAVGEDKSARFRAALETYVTNADDHPLASLALHHWALSHHGEEDFVRAHALATRGATRFPDSPGGQLCRNLITQIESPSLNVVTEGVWSGDQAPIRIIYKNLSRLHLRAVAYDWIELVGRDRDPERLNEADRRALLAKAPTSSWSVDLQPTPDYKPRGQDSPTPKLAPGSYYILASPDPGFMEQDNIVSSAAVWVSELAIVTRPRAGRVEGFVLEASTGEPVVGAEVRAWRYQERWMPVAPPTLLTDEHGFFTLRSEPRQRYLLWTRKGDDRLAVPYDLRVYERGEEPPQDRIFFFTDRSLYRPGQMVHYKGIWVHADRAKNDYATVPEKDVTVILADANDQEIARQVHRSNQRGSFSGTFTIPPGLLTGMMRLRAENAQRDGVHFSVEEYKRPRFEVTLDPPRTAAALNQVVELTGKAETYTGAAVDQAELRYRVVREVRWPFWRGWFRPDVSRDRQEIAHGTARTAADGTFTLTFPALPAADALEKDEPTFQFTVSVDVTDASGETRSDSQSITVGFTTFQANLTLDNWQTVTNPVSIQISTTTLDGEPITAEGVIRIYSLKEPPTVPVPPLLRPLPQDIDQADSSDPNRWDMNEQIAQHPFSTDGAGKAVLSVPLTTAGLYRVVLESRDPNGRAVTARAPTTVLNPAGNRFTLKLPQLVAAPKWTWEPGEQFRALWGTGYEFGRAFIEIEHRHQLIRRFWTDDDRTQQQIEHAITEAMRGGFTLHVTQVRHNRALIQSRHVDVPWSNKELKLRWEHFTSKLKPGAEETWTAVITGHDAEPAAAETLAALYDASLDAYRDHSWPRQFGVFYYDASSAQPQFANQSSGFRHLFGGWDRPYLDVSLTYRHFPPELELGFRQQLMRGRLERFRGMTPASAAAPEAAFLGAELALADGATPGVAGGAADFDAKLGEAPPKPDLDQVTARKNLNETAFFFPHLVSNKDGEVRLQFTMPEALTRWRFLAFAHDERLRGGYLEDTAVTSKDIMIRPNPPRFLREGDTLEFTATVLNQSPTRQTGRVRLTLSDAATGAPVDLKIPEPEQTFDIPAQQSAAFSWRLEVGDGLGILVYKAVAATDRLSDGEEGYLPVLPRRILVTESLPLPIHGPGRKEFTFTNLLRSAESKSLAHQSLTVQMASQPAWYAIMALPFLMEFPHECTEQTFNRYYANSLARTIALSDPKIRRVFDLWKNTDALDSPLEKNEDLKSLALEATPWVRQAQSESQARRHIGLLFDENRLRDESARILQKLGEQQRQDGAWSWFPGGQANHYITLYITTGFGRLRHLGADTPVEPALRALDYLDLWLTERHREILKAGTEKDNHLSPTIALHLYTRGFFLADKPVPDEHRLALDYFISQARTHWLKLLSRQSKAHIALGLHRFGAPVAGETPRQIMRSIHEHSVTSPELGMFWRDTENAWSWERAPIETQALMIEAFDEITADSASVDACRVWLLKQKQTQGWKTTKATADAVYSLLLRGANLLASDHLVRVDLAGDEVDPGRVEPGTGFYEARLVGPQITPALARITLAKQDQGIAWGSVHWQYFQDVAEVTPSDASPLKVEKTLHTRKLTSQGPVLEPVTAPLAVGDELIVRIVVRVDRDMEFVHLKDQRGSGTEPVNVLSGHRWQDGLGYYESTRDTASHFFIDYLRKGTYVFEYPSRVVHRGSYQTGLAEIQCMYAPEFNSHSASHPLVVR